MMELFTGLPGAGKSLRAVEEGLRYVAAGRRVFVDGVNDLDFESTGMLPYTWPIEEWQERLDPGDVLIVDECQRYFPVGLVRSGNPPKWVEALTRNRHGGVDLLLITQDAANISKFVRNLINVHVHLVNKYGKPVAKVYKWIDGVHDTSSVAEKRRAETFDWKYPVALYSKYTSAELHTRKASVPRKMRVFQVALVAFICLLGAGVWYAKQEFGVVAEKPEKASAKSAPSSSASAGIGSQMFSDRAKRAPMTKKEFLDQQVPRIPGVMWSAPLFDSRKAEAQPETYCIAMDAGPCFCRTEQGTSAIMPDAQCRNIARNGLYNPFRRPVEVFDRSQLPVAAAVAPVDPARSDSVVSAAGSMASDPRVPVSPGGPRGSRRAADHKVLSSAYDAGVFAPKTDQY